MRSFEGAGGPILEKHNPGLQCDPAAIGSVKEGLLSVLPVSCGFERVGSLQDGEIIELAPNQHETDR